MTIALIPAGTIVYRGDSLEPIIIPRDIQVDVTIILDDIEVSEFTLDDLDYTVWTTDVIWSSRE